jgi:hypothetical protein
MIALTPEILEKLSLLDGLLDSMDTSQIRALVNSEQLVSKLKGDYQPAAILGTLVQEHNMMKNDVMNLKMEITNLRSEIKELIRAINTAVYSPPFNQEFNVLKNRYGIY